MNNKIYKWISNCYIMSCLLRLNPNTIFSRGLKSMQYRNFVNYDYAVANIMIHYFNVYPYTLIHSPWKSHPDSKRRVILPIREVVHYSFCWIAQIHKLTVNYLSPCKELITWIFYTTPNVPKSCIMQVIWAWMLK